jgi:putative tryptophan/tyrosine transport system substrate-binding protein
MNRREFIAALGGAATAVWPLTALAQQSGRAPVIGFLSNGSAARSAETLGEFVYGLRELGYIEGRQITIVVRWAEGHSERLPEFAAELVRLGVDVIVAAPTQSVRVAQQATRTIPIVMANSADPVRFGFVESLARPAGNITGLSNQAADIGTKQLALLKEMVPAARRVAVLINPRNPSHDRWRDDQGPAAQLGMSLEPVEAVSDAAFDGVDRALAAIERRRPDALLVLGDGLFLNRRERITEWAAANRVPALYLSRDDVEAGGLMSYGASLRANFRRAATYVDKILKGAKPGDLPVEQPIKFEFVINLKTAKALGLAVPPSLIARADEVIE